MPVMRGPIWLLLVTFCLAVWAGIAILLYLLRRLFAPWW
jgi:hypothetical protein